MQCKYLMTSAVSLSHFILLEVVRFSLQEVVRFSLLEVVRFSANPLVKSELGKLTADKGHHLLFRLLLSGLLVDY